MAERVETIVIGAGVVGLATARALAMTGREVLVLEREDLIGSITSSRNSEVIHAGIYYPKDSLKARLCVEGRRRLYDYCETRHVPFNRCGKLIVATETAEDDKLHAILAKAQANGVEDARIIAGAEARGMEPALSATSAILSPSTGVVDSHGLMLSLLGEAEGAGAMLALGAPVTGAAPGFVFDFGGAAPMRLKAREVVNAAGHGGPKIAAMIPELAVDFAPRQHFAKGNYFSLTGRAPFSRLIYPAPVSGGLGVHLTIDLSGAARFGPDVEWVEGEDYAVTAARGDAFYAAIRRYWPDLNDGALQPDYAGVRPKLAAKGEPDADFWIKGPEAHGVAGYVGLAGIESPGLTASLAIAEEVLARLRA